ncbi:MAG: GNAT family protein [Chitinophagales bacterium]
MEIIIDDKLKLRAWQPEDKLELQRIANNLNLTKYLRELFPSPYTANDAERWISLNEMGLDETQFCIAYDEKPIGNIGIYIQRDVHKYTAELGYWLSEEHWNKGIITECIKTVVPYFIKKFGLKRVFATTFSENIGSSKALESAGFALEGTMKNHAFKGGIDYDGKLYAYTV